MKKFVVATNRATVEQRNAITRFFQSKSIGFWHHFNDLWLVSSNQFDGTIQLRDALITEAPGVLILVLEVDVPNTTKPWSGFGRKKMWPWLQKFWRNDRREGI